MCRVHTFSVIFLVSPAHRPDSSSSEAGNLKWKGSLNIKLSVYPDGFFLYRHNVSAAKEDILLDSLHGKLIVNFRISRL
ncbi:hypothetical protein KP509_30G044000 [Ceratopteris richardii]|uniref:Uncharacterized protein n=1 Tax=Ceratopteris richardii TaxID=49495 RepID=A0A8T2R4A2_CERRI|nr:hypothetical protein KP509_30G044000 [Ceratopteris richardii]